MEEASKGNVFIIAKAGKPMVKVVPLSEDDVAESEKLGFMSGEITVPDDFNLMGAGEIQNLFEGEKA